MTFENLRREEVESVAAGLRQQAAMAAGRGAHADAVRLYGEADRISGGVPVAAELPVRERLSPEQEHSRFLAGLFGAQEQAGRQRTAALFGQRVDDQEGDE